MLSSTRKKRHNISHYAIDDSLLAISLCFNGYSAFTFIMLTRLFFKPIILQLFGLKFAMFYLQSAGPIDRCISATHLGHDGLGIVVTDGLNGYCWRSRNVSYTARDWSVCRRSYSGQGIRSHVKALNSGQSWPTWG